ncbi:nucleotide sugar dehydrogenase [Carnobacterium divergens]|uniref:Nucleotide sugar dehydrogenase n=2 Tax=Carnobacterium divergens TaxID=2748 RepID=A0AAW8R9H8_CARDV|nr:nucleotide sugar dehydrogenase [Carnobacterium divergens]MDT1973179.1 nucleotide sugar dehydrogenase [Carnobacterium divergens]MDT2012243.1 nucleotide sugar dehydrogenase [Carnobacterium divergens]
MKIVTIGLGYIGLPTAIMFANYGQQVIGVDVQSEVVNSLQEGQVHIEEPGLQEALTRAISSENFKAQTQVEQADVFIVAVPTPNKEDRYKSCDLTYVISAVNSLIPFLEKGNTVIVESTIAPRTTEDVILPLIEEAGFKVGEDVFLVHCPERVLPGKILQELRYNNRIIGGVTEACTKSGKEIYGIFVKGELISSSASAAELSKLMENTYRDVNIALANELAKIGDTLAIDSLEVIEMANKHPRVNIHSPGPGVGGHCLAVDPYFISSMAPTVTPLIQQAREINSTMPAFIVEKVEELMTKIDGKKITVLGVTYKGNVDDIRESPALEIVDLLKEKSGYELSIFDPHVEKEWIEKEFKNAVINSDLLLVLTDHDEFKTIDVDQLVQMRQKVVFDTKNIFGRNPAIKLISLGSLANIRDLNMNEK